MAHLNAQGEGTRILSAAMVFGDATKPPLGATRIRRRYAFLPIVVEGVVVWDSWVEELWGYVGQEVTVAVNGVPVSFRVGRWEKLSARAL